MTQTAEKIEVAQHTPGPWDYLKSNNSNLILIETPGDHPNGAGIHIASLAGKKNPVAEANARLIAAAPELLEALIDLHEWVEVNKHLIDCNDSERRIWLYGKNEKARTAIAKARGE